MSRDELILREFGLLQETWREWQAEFMVLLDHLGVEFVAGPGGEHVLRVKRMVEDREE